MTAPAGGRWCWIGERGPELVMVPPRPPLQARRWRRWFGRSAVAAVVAVLIAGAFLFGAGGTLVAGFSIGASAISLQARVSVQ